MLEDPSVTIVERAVDPAWRYRGIVPSPSATGFRPFYGEVLVPATGPIATWLRRPHADTRPLNIDDLLVRDVLFMVHDYLHGWAYGHARQLGCPVMPGYTPITEENLEDHVFVHLVTEACATVGLDYWYLCTVDLNEVCSIGTLVRGMTTSFHETWMDEYRRFSPTLQVQQPSFFADLARFYCSGEFEGFGRRALERSPITAKWLRHELAYGEKQRIYTRQWLSHLGGLRPPGDRASKRKVDHAAPWQLSLIEEIGDRLFEKVKSDRVLQPKLAPRRGRHTPVNAQCDFRFTNLAAMSDEEIDQVVAAGIPTDQFSYFAAQYVATFRHRSFRPHRLPLLKLALKHRDPHSLVAAMRGAPALTRGVEPRDVFFLA